MIIYAAGNICQARTKPGITLACRLLFQQPCFRDSFEKHPVSISLTTGETFRQKTKRMPNLFISVHETLLFLHQNLIILHILTHSHITTTVLSFFYLFISLGFPLAQHTCTHITLHLNKILLHRLCSVLVAAPVGTS